MIYLVTTPKARIELSTDVGIEDALLEVAAKPVDFVVADDAIYYGYETGNLNHSIVKL